MMLRKRVGRRARVKRKMRSGGMVVVVVIGRERVEVAAWWVDMRFLSSPVLQASETKEGRRKKGREEDDGR